MIVMTMMMMMMGVLPENIAEVPDIRSCHEFSGVVLHTNNGRAMSDISETHRIFLFFSSQTRQDVLLHSFSVFPLQPTRASRERRELSQRGLGGPRP